MRHSVTLPAVAALLGALAASPAGAAASCTAFTLASSKGLANGGTYHLCGVDTARFGKALCNDGSTPVFQVQPAASGTSTRWLIWLVGGYECVDAASCAARATGATTHRLVTSTLTTTPVLGRGLLSHDPALNPALADANTVSVPYCSSDDWSGDYRPPRGTAFDAGDPTTWNFQGRANAAAVIGTLRALPFGFLNATQVLLGGGSSGAAGATYVLGDVLPMLPRRAQAMLINDAGFILDVGAYDGSLPNPHESQAQPTPIDAYMAQGRALWHGHGDSACDAAAVTDADHLACYNTAFLLQAGYVTVPSFVSMSQLDTPSVSFQLCPTLGGKCGVPRKPTSPQGQYAIRYAQQMAALLGGDGPPYTAFSPNAYVHTMLDIDSVFTTPFQFGGQTITPRDAFGAWYANPTAPGRAILGSGPGVQ